MSESPFQRAQDEGLNEPSGRSTEGSGKTRRKRKPTSKIANRKKKIKARYQKAREEAQLAGVIPMTPDGAAEEERTCSVDPLSGLPKLVQQALRDNWATPGAAKPAIIAALLRPFFSEVPIMTKDGDLVNVPASPKLLNELARTIAALDERQWARDNPEAAGKAKGGNSTTNTSIQANVLAVQVLREALERDEGRGATALPPPVESIPPSHSRFDGEVETGAASTED